MWQEEYIKMFLMTYANILIQRIYSESLSLHPFDLEIDLSK